MEKTARHLNRANWDARAAVHGQDRYYDSAGLIAGKVSLGKEEQAAIDRAVGDVDGLDICHVQCHIGFDSILLARAGARVIGLDFSPASLSKAKVLAEQCGAQVGFVEADACDPPHDLHGKFDLVYATIGVLSWIDDVEAWMAAAARLARPNGHLVLVDGHPVVTMFDSYDPPVTDFPYNFDRPHYFDAPGTYADQSAKLSATRTVQYAHGLGEIVTAAIRAGWQIAYLEEATSATFDFRGDLGQPEPDGRYRLRLGVEALPILSRFSPGCRSPRCNRLGLLSPRTGPISRPWPAADSLGPPAVAGVLASVSGDCHDRFNRLLSLTR